MIKRILKTIIIIFMYILGGFLILAGSVTIDDTFYSSTLDIISGIILLPVVSHFWADKLNWSFKKENITKVIIAFIIFIVSIIVYPGSDSNVSASKQSENNAEEKVTCKSFNSIQKDDTLSVKKLSCYDFGKVLKPILDELQIDDIKKITIEDIEDDSIRMILKTNTTELRCVMYQNISEVWYVSNICENNDSSINYYIYDNYIDPANTILKDDIYSYKTKEIVQKRDVDQIGEYYRQQEEKRNQEKQARINEITQESQENIKAIYSDYQNNELAAKKNHKGKTYTFAGTFNGASDSGILNKINNEVEVEIIVRDASGQGYKLYCGFDSDEWKDKLKEYNKGDEIYITGKCYNWGNYNECNIITIY